jgi:poly(ADP-ribose) glycohydrolase ARH3
MRIAPVGLAFRNADQKVLHSAVMSALLCTHVHPEAVDGSLLQAVAVADMCKISDLSQFDAVALVKKLKDLSATDIIRNKIQQVLDFYEKKEEDMTVVLAVCEPNMFGRQFQIRSSEALACALWSLLKYGNDPELCIIKTVGYGGDADTVGAIVGALMGALHGTKWIPRRWYDSIYSDRNFQYNMAHYLQI